MLRSIAAYEEVFLHYARWDWADVVEEAMRYVAPISEFHRSSIEEMRGIAEGAQVRFEDIMALNVRTEVMFSAKSRQATSGRVAECSAFAVLPEASSNSHTLIGQNWDWLLHSKETVVVLEARQSDGPDFVSIVEAGLLAKSGMNSAGIGLATNALATEKDLGEPGIPYHVVLRALLDAETMSDALTTLQAGFRSSSANYVLAHRDGLAVSIEGASGDFSDLHLLFPDSGVLLHTNHFLSSSFTGRDVSLWVMPDSPFRLDRIRRAVSSAGCPIDLDAFRRILTDHANYPSGVCCHPDQRMHPWDQGATVASVLMDLDARKMWLSDGYPCTAPFRELDYSDFLSKPPSTRRDDVGPVGSEVGRGLG